MVVLDDDEEDLKAQEDADWLPLPPPRVPSSGLGLQEDSTLLELRSDSILTYFTLRICSFS